MHTQGVLLDTMEWTAKKVVANIVKTTNLVTMSVESVFIAVWMDILEIFATMVRTETKCFNIL